MGRRCQHIQPKPMYEQAEYQDSYYIDPDSKRHGDEQHDGSSAIVVREIGRKDRHRNGGVQGGEAAAGISNLQGAVWYLQRGPRRIYRYAEIKEQHRYAIGRYVSEKEMYGLGESQGYR